MILFADTSALVKLYVEEPGSDVMLEAAADRAIALSPLAYAETHATFAHRAREGLLDEHEHRMVCDAFQADWPTSVLVPFGPEVLRHVPVVCRQHPLRGADALQLACALMLQAEDVEITFATADLRLAEAAASYELRVLDPNDRG